MPVYELYKTSVRRAANQSNYKMHARSGRCGLTLIRWLFWSQQLFSYESDDGMRITAQGLCCVSITKKNAREGNYFFWKLGRNHKQCPASIESPETGEQEDVLIQRVSARTLLPNPEMVHHETQSRRLGLYAAHRISKCPSVCPL